MRQTRRTPIGKLIEVKERPETTLSLIRAIKDPVKTVSTYVFTDSIRSYFVSILESVATGRGQGFWVPAEYGAGKTHFLATLAVLLSDNSEELWAKVQDSEIANYRHRLQNTRFFPIVLSLRGEGEIEGGGRSLLQIIEKGTEESLEERNLRDRVVVTSAEEVFAWFTGLPASLEEPISSYIKEQVGVSAEEYLREAGQETLAQLIRQFCAQHNISPKLTASTKERFSYIYRQLTENIGGVKYDGLLLVIDEFAFWQDTHPEGSPEYARDEEVLETLAFLLPKELGLRIYTIIASQKPVPVKLRGGAVGDRFINLPLLGGGSERDYDVIVSKRVRDLLPDMIPEINQYYDYYSHNFEFMKDISEETFRTIFPFQPRCFEVLRRITARQLPTTRIGINVLHEIIDPHARHNKDPYSETNILARDELVAVASLLLSSDLIDGLKETPIYRDAYQAYATAMDGLLTLALEEDEQELARSIIKTLFLWHLTYLDAPRPMSLQDLAQATLTTEDVLKPEDAVALTLVKLRDLPQIAYSKERGASFIVQLIGPSAPQVFNETKQRITDPYRIQRKWQESLCLSAIETMGEPTLFADLTLNQPKQVKIENRKIEYSGNVILTDAWRPELGEPIQGEDHHFRIILLTQNAEVKVDAIEDERIAVCIPNGLSEATRDAARGYLAILEMEDTYRSKMGSEAEQIRDWIRNKKPELVRELIGSQPKQYQAGKICTKSQLAIDAKEIFSLPNNERRFATIANALLNSAYTILPVSSAVFKKTFSSADAGKVFSGLFHRDASGSAKSACDNFAIGLGLAKSENPRKFAPMPPRVFEYLKEKLEENKGHLDTWRVYQDLSNIHGLPYSLITLYILCFVRYGSPLVDLYLKANHPIILRSGSKPPQNRLTSALIPEIEWKTGLERYFDALSVSIGPTWNDVVPFARVIKPELRTTTEPSEIKGQEELFLEALGSLRTMTNQVKGSVELLSTKLGGTPEKEQQDALARVSEVIQASDFNQFYQKVQERYTQPEPFAQDLSIYHRWEELSRATAEILDTKSYLDAMALRNSDHELQLSLLSLRGQLNLKSLVDNPSLWPALKANFDGFKKRYRNTYQIHHRDYYKKVAELRQQLEEQKIGLEALRKLNTVIELGEPLGVDIFQHYQNLLQSLKICPITVVTDVPVESQPTCADCNLPLTQEPSSEEVERLSKKLEKALKEQLRRLGSEAVKQILVRSKEDKIIQFSQIVQLGDLSSLLNIIDDEVIEFIRVLLQEGRIQTVAQPILERLAERYAVVEEEKLEEVVAEFKRLLLEAFEVAKKEYPDKKLRVNLRGS